MKAQTTVEYSTLLSGLLILTIIIIGIMFGVFYKTSSQIQSTNVYSFQNIYFYPASGQGENLSSYLGTTELNVLTTSATSFSDVYLIQNTLNSSVKTNCPSNIQFSGFPQTGLICIALGKPSTILSESNNLYLFDFSNTTYNGTAFRAMNNTDSQYIEYAVFNINGKIYYDKLSPELQISIE